MKLNLLAGAFALSMIGMAGTANAVSFTINTSGYTVGSGYGSGQNQLDAKFTPLISSPVSFELSNVGDVWAQAFGLVTLGNEKCISGAAGQAAAGCLGSAQTDNGSSNAGNETQNLDVLAYIDFSNPFNGLINSVAVTGTYVGPTGDAAVDYFIDFSPLTINFGEGGSFILDLGDLNFTNKNQLIPQAISIYLASAPVSIPAPGSLAVLGGGLVGLAALRRRKDA